MDADPAIPLVISTQPQSAYSNFENGEPIIMEAVCKREYLIQSFQSQCCSAGAYLFATSGILPGICLCAIGIPIGRCLGKRAANAWSMYLTSTALHYHIQNNVFRSCFSTSEMTQTTSHSDLSDIQAIMVAETNVPGYCICDDKKVPGTTVKVILKPGRRHDLRPHWCFRPLIETCLTTDESSVTLTLDNCANAEEFVEAVKQQLPSE